jgi:hypothetical protein
MHCGNRSRIHFTSASDPDALSATISLLTAEADGIDLTAIGSNSSAVHSVTGPLEGTTAVALIVINVAEGAANINSIERQAAAYRTLAERRRRIRLKLQ